MKQETKLLRRRVTTELVLMRAIQDTETFWMSRVRYHIRVGGKR